MTQYAILTDLNKCTGCLACMVACKVVNNVPIGSYWNKVLRVGPNLKPGATQYPDLEMYFVPVQCQHCQNPACVGVCPTEASHKTADGTIQIDKEKCIGCQFCAMACPYGVRYLNEEERVVEKCTLCEQKVAQGELPQCVAQCGGVARFFGDLDQGIESFVGPVANFCGETFGERVGDSIRSYQQSEVFHLPDVGNSPSFVYILRDHEWKGEN